MPYVFRVGLCGASTSDAVLLRAIFSHSLSGQRYGLAVCEPAEPRCDIAIVFETGAGAAAQWQALKARNPDAVAVVVGENERPGTPNYVARRYLVMRIRPMLEALIDARTGAGAPRAQPERVIALPQRAPEQLRPPTLLQPNTAQRAPATSAPHAVSRTAIAGRVLIVDDSAVSRAQAGEQMAKLGFERLAASHAEQALRVIERGGVDLILLDVEMPGMDGYALCRKLKHEHQWRLIPIVMLTSHGLPFDRARGAFAGCDGYLTKPLVEAQLQATIERLRDKILRGRAAQPASQTAS
jgi:CheY-like chemotaxis protein